MSDIIVTEADREVLKTIFWPHCHEAIDRGDYDSHTDMQAIARHAAQAGLDSLEEAAKVADRIAYEQRVKRATDGQDSGGIVATGYVATAIRNLSTRGDQK